MQLISAGAKIIMAQNEGVAQIEIILKCPQGKKLMKHFFFKNYLSILSTSRQSVGEAPTLQILLSKRAESRSYLTFANQIL